jgi:hypothetical protein
MIHPLTPKRLDGVLSHLGEALFDKTKASESPKSRNAHSNVTAAANLS